MLCLPPSTRKPIGGAQRGQILIEDSSCVFSLNFRLVRMEVCHKGHYKPGRKSFGRWINGLSGAKWCSPALGSSIVLTKKGLRKGLSLLAIGQCHVSVNLDHCTQPGHSYGLCSTASPRQLQKVVQMHSLHCWQVLSYI